MLSVPPVNVEIGNAADPPLSEAVPSVVVPCRNVIVSPSGGAPWLELTVAVKVTDWPYVDGLSEDEMVVVVVVSAALTPAAIPSKTTRHAIFFIHVLSLGCQSFPMSPRQTHTSTQQPLSFL